MLLGLSWRKQTSVCHYLNGCFYLPYWECIPLLLAARKFDWDKNVREEMWVTRFSEKKKRLSIKGKERKAKQINKSRYHNVLNSCYMNLETWLISILMPSQLFKKRKIPNVNFIISKHWLYSPDLNTCLKTEIHLGSWKSPKNREDIGNST